MRKEHRGRRRPVTRLPADLPRCRVSYFCVTVLGEINLLGDCAVDIEVPCERHHRFDGWCYPGYP